MSPSLTVQSVRVITVRDTTTRLSPSGTGGASYNPVLSPDGKFMIFTSTARLTSDDLDNAPDVYMKDLVHGTLTNLSARGTTTGYTSPGAFSPNGEYILLTSDIPLTTDDVNQSLDVYLRDSQGNLALLSSGQPGEGSVDWGLSPDGRSVLVFSSAKLTQDDNNTTNDLYLKVIGGDMVRLTPDQLESGPSVVHMIDAQFSPDGQSVVFVTNGRFAASDTNSNNDVYLRDGSGNVICLTAGAMQTGDSDAARFSPDGRSVLVRTKAKLTADDTDTASTDLYLVDLASGAKTLLSGGGLSEGDSGRAQFSPDGKQVVFESNARLTSDDTDNDTDIYLVDLASGAKMLLSGGDISRGASGRAQFSPDGKQVMFESDARLTSDDTNEATDIYLKDLVSGALTRISSDGSFADDSGSAQFSPDGRSIIFESNARIADDDRNNLEDIYLTNIALKMIEGRFLETSFFVGNASAVSIAWGDGTFESATPAGGSVSFQHIYAIRGQKSATVTIQEGAQTLVAPYVIDLVNGQMSRSALASTLSGAQGHDTLVGDETANILMGYIGKDTLTGGAGQDVFMFDAKLAKTNKLNKKQNLDKITDFVVADDTIHLKKSVFSKIKKTGVLKKGEFYIGAKAHDRDDQVIYNKKTGALFYDADGTGVKEAIQFATLSKNLKLTHLDFFVV
ncbi:hypothetical protein AB4097_09125 [Microvirga sp. 2MCAF35]|uniref:TolB family protein n=1 Tax=Microvirga sp. 2MCAF35 TaxID=3232987 RepID=UPI003F97D9EE